MDRERFRERRRELGLSQEALARALGVTRQSVYNWERGGVPQRMSGLVSLALDALTWLPAIKRFAAINAAPADLVYVGDSSGDDAPADGSEHGS